MRWKNKAAVRVYRKLSAKYGPPSNKDLALGGLALWKRSKLRSTCFEEILLRDEDIPHCAPYPHRDFLYTSVAARDLSIAHVFQCEFWVWDTATWVLTKAN